MTKSPRQPFSSGYAELVNDLMSLPKGSDYTVGVQQSYLLDTTMGSRAAQGGGYVSAFDTTGADPQLLAMLQDAIKKMGAYFSGPGSYMSTTPSTQAMGAHYQDMIPALEAAVKISTGQAQQIQIGDITLNFAGADKEGKIDISGIMAQIESKIRSGMQANRSSLGGMQAWG
jgi:hypothetical protein